MSSSTSLPATPFIAASWPPLTTTFPLWLELELELELEVAPSEDSADPAAAGMFLWDLLLGLKTREWVIREVRGWHKDTAQGTQTPPYISCLSLSLYGIIIPLWSLKVTFSGRRGRRQPWSRRPPHWPDSRCCRRSSTSCCLSCSSHRPCLKIL